MRVTDAEDVEEYRKQTVDGLYDLFDPRNLVERPERTPGGARLPAA